MTRMPRTLAPHPAAELFPIDQETIGELAADIKANGLRQPIELLAGKIIDGRRRYLACQLASVKPKTIDIETEDPVAYVLSLNLHRRHLTPSQRAMVGARAREMYDEAAKERQKQGKEKLPYPDHAGQARDAAGKAVGVSGKTIDHATRVLMEAEPEVVKAVDEGRMAVSTAAILASEKRSVQVAEATCPKRRRNYVSVSASASKNGHTAVQKPPGESRGVGVRYANAAIDQLKRIPKNDGLRARAFQIVIDWIKEHRS